MANVLKMAKISSILSLHASGWKQSRIAAELGIDRETVPELPAATLGRGKTRKRADRHRQPKTSRIPGLPAPRSKPAGNCADRLLGGNRRAGTG